MTMAGRCIDVARLLIVNSVILIAVFTIDKACHGSTII